MIEQKNLWVFEPWAPQVSAYQFGTLFQESRFAEYIVAARGRSHDQFLGPSKKHLHDPFLMPGMAKVRERLLDAIENDEKITIYGDYDVDGITGTVLLMKCLHLLGANVDYHIPNRENDGYGLNNEAISQIAASGSKLIITVDCGIAAYEEVIYANTLGVDVIITDHHEPSNLTPLAKGIINPKLTPSQYPFRELAGVGVAFKLAHALLGDLALNNQEFYQLVALGTVADIVPLVDENRVLVSLGLKEINVQPLLGIESIIKTAGLKTGQIGSDSIAFAIAPRINAAGRIRDARIGVELLMSEDITQSIGLASELDALNHERQNIEAAMVDQAKQLIIEKNYSDSKVFVLSHENWHIGVLGIVAGKIMDEFNKPTLMITQENGVSKGSARSLGWLNILDALEYCQDILVKYGGHKLAAGVTLCTSDIPSLRRRLNDYVNQEFLSAVTSKSIQIDGELDICNVDIDLAKSLDQMAPFGQDNSRPTFLARNIRISEFRKVGKNGNHLKIRVCKSGEFLDAIGFNSGEIADSIAYNEDYDIVYNIEVNQWNGKETVQIRIRDMKSSDLIPNLIERGGKSNLIAIIKNQSLAAGQKGKTSGLERSQHIKKPLPGLPGGMTINELKGWIDQGYLNHDLGILVNSRYQAEFLINQFQRLDRLGDEFRIIESDSIQSNKVFFSKMKSLGKKAILLLVAGTSTDFSVAQYLEYVIIPQPIINAVLYNEIVSEFVDKNPSICILYTVDQQAQEAFNLMLKKIIPDRITLGKLYKALYQIPADADGFCLGHQSLSKNSWDTKIGIEIFEEIGLLEKKSIGGTTRIRWINHPSERLDLMNSQIYRIREQNN